MPTDTDGTHRSLHDPRPESVTLREADEIEGDDDMMEVRMPIASSGEVRNEGDDPLTTSELRGMADQVDTLTRGVFPEHGMSNAVDREQYSQFEKLGYWAAADLEREASDDGEDMLVATARMPDPETLPAATGDYREALAILKEQAKRGIPIASSIAWRDDGDYPGGVDLMEASIVGIGADPRTSTEGGTEALARAAVDAGADPDEFLTAVRRIVHGDAQRAPDSDGARPFGPPGGDPTMWEDFDACVADVSDWDNIDDPEAFCNWAEQQSADASETSDSEQMTDTDDPGDEQAGTDTDSEQDGGDAEQTERAPDDVTPDDLAAVVASAYDGVSASDLVDAWDDMADFTGSVGMDPLAALVATAVDADTEDIMAMFEDLLETADGDGEEQAGDKGEDYEEDDEDDEDERAADADADREGDTDLAAEVRDLREQHEQLREDIRTGEVEFERADAEDDDTERDADADGEDGDTDEQRDTDDGSTLRDEWLSTDE